MELGIANNQLKETIPAKRFGTPEEYAAIAIDGGLISGI